MDQKNRKIEEILHHATYYNDVNVLKAVFLRNFKYEWISILSGWFKDKMQIVQKLREAIVGIFILQKSHTSQESLSARTFHEIKLQVCAQRAEVK